jgi:MFS superfamily sulfate permease-like transporter
MEKIWSLNGYNQKNPDLYAKILELEAEIAELKQKQQNPQTIIIENLNIRKVDVDKFEFKLDGITVEDLSGMLNVGINSDGKMKTKEINK